MIPVKASTDSGLHIYVILICLAEYKGKQLLPGLSPLTPNATSCTTQKEGRVAGVVVLKSEICLYHLPFSLSCWFYRNVAGAVLKS